MGTLFSSDLDDWDPVNPCRPCPVCGGTGKDPRRQYERDGDPLRTRRQVCRACDGEGIVTPDEAVLLGMTNDE